MTYGEFDALPAAERSDIGACDECEFGEHGIELCEWHEFGPAHCGLDECDCAQYAGR